MVFSYLKKTTFSFGSGYSDLAIFQNDADMLSDLVLPWERCYIPPYLAVYDSSIKAKFESFRF